MNKAILAIVGIIILLTGCSKGREEPQPDRVLLRELKYVFVPGGSNVEIVYSSIEQNKPIRKSNVTDVSEFIDKANWSDNVSLLMLSEQGLTKNSSIKLMYKDRIIKEVIALEGDKQLKLDHTIKQEDTK